MLKQTLIFPILLLAWLLTFTGHVRAQENYPMMLMLKINNNGKPADKLEMLKINTKLKSIPAPRPLVVHGYHRKTDAYAIFIKDYRVGQAVEDSKAVYPYLKQELLKMYPNASFELLHYTHSGELEK
jgi:hypothetical protein